MEHKDCTISCIKNGIHSEMNEITNVISDINMDSVLYIDLIDNDLNDMTVIKDIVDKIKHYSK